MYRFIFILFLSICTSSKLNVPRILLPVLESTSISYILEASEDGCYDWDVTPTDIIQVSLLDVTHRINCGNKALVETVTKQFTRNAAVIFAEDVVSEEVLRCDVIVDVISSLKIMTITRQLYLDETPEMFEVRAYDLYGNEFSSLEGIDFEWKFKNVNENGANVLQFISPSAVQYTVATSARQSEGQNGMSRIVWIGGVKIGSAKKYMLWKLYGDSPINTFGQSVPKWECYFKTFSQDVHYTVWVSIKHPEYEHVKSDEVVLKVMTSCIVSPSIVNILVGDTVEFKLLKVINRDLVEIPLYDSRYYLKAENQLFVRYITESKIEGSQLGQTKIQLYDRQNPLKDQDASQYLPFAMVTIDAPFYLNLIMLPQNNWILTEFEQSSIYVEILNADNKPIHIGSNAVVNIVIDEKYYRKAEITRNGSYISGWPVMPGVVQVFASFESVINPQTNRTIRNNRLTTEMELIIYSTVTVEPFIMVLPWDIHLLHKSFVFTVSGGDGIYRWTSNDSSVASISHNGILNVHNTGSTRISVFMKRKPDNVKFSHVRVLPVASMKIFYDTLNARENLPINLYIALYPDVAYDDDVEGNRRAFNDGCSYLPLNVTFSSDSSTGSFRHKTFNLSNNDRINGDACIGLSITVPIVTVTQVTVSYVNVITGITIRDTVTVSTYRPLALIEPIDGYTVLSIGSSRNLIYELNLNSLTAINTEHVQLIYDDKNRIDVTELFKPPPVDNKLRFGRADKEGRLLLVYSVSCKAYGTTVISMNKTITRSHSIDNDDRYNYYLHNHNRNNEDDDLNVKVICARPKFIQLGYSSVKSDKNCLLPATHWSRGIVLDYKDVKINVVVKDEYSRTFDNATGLKIDWFLSESLGRVKYVGGVALNEKRFNDIILPSDHYQIVVPNKTPGDIELTATIADIETVRGTFRLTLVDDLYVTPNNIEVVHNPTVPIELRIEQGSGYFEVTSSNSDVASGIYKRRLDSNDNTINIITKSSGSVKLTVRDVCLVSSKPYEVDVTVRILNRLDVQLERRKLEVDETIICTIKFYDNVDDTLNYVAVKKWLSLKHVQTLSSSHSANNDNESLKLKEIINDDNDARFAITAINEATVDLTFFAELADGSRIKADAITVQVFPKLNITPDNIVAFPGMTLKITPVGGPPADMEPILLYRVDDDSVIKVNDDQQLEALTFGETTVSVVPVVSNLLNGENTVYTAARVNVRIVELNDVRINVPLTNIKIGSKMPLWIESLPLRLTPSIMGLITPSFKVIWWSSAPSVISIYDDFRNMGFWVQSSDAISVRIKALRVGIAFICVNVSVPSTGKSFKQSVLIKVVEEFKAIGMDENALKPCCMSPRTNFQIETKTDDVKPLSYIMINVEFPVYRNTSTLINHMGPLPRGITLRLRISFHDPTGTEIGTVKSSIKYEMNHLNWRTSLSSEDSNNLELNLTENGETVIKISTTYKSKLYEDYIKLSTATYVKPSETSFTVGDVVCFSVPFWLNVPHGVWSSDDTSALSIDSTKAVILFREPRTKVNVYYRQGNVTVASTSITILPLEEILIAPLTRDFIVNNDSPTIFELMLHGEGEHIGKKTNSLFKSDDCGGKPSNVTSFPFHCEFKFETRDEIAGMDVEDIFRVKRQFDFNTGLYNCILETIEEHNFIVATSIRSNILFRVLWDENKHSEIRSVEFIPKMYVHPRVFTMDCDNDKAIFYVKGHPRVLELVEVTNTQKIISIEKTISSESLVYTISTVEGVTGGLDMSFFVTFVSPLTNDNVNATIRLNSHRSKRYCKLMITDDTYFSFESILFIFTDPVEFLSLLIGILVIVGVYYFVKYIWRRNHIVDVDPNVHIQEWRPPFNNHLGRDTVPFGWRNRLTLYDQTRLRRRMPIITNSRIETMECPSSFSHSRPSLTKTSSCSPGCSVIGSVYAQEPNVTPQRQLLESSLPSSLSSPRTNRGIKTSTPINYN